MCGCGAPAFLIVQIVQTSQHSGANDCDVEVAVVMDITNYFRSAYWPWHLLSFMNQLSSMEVEVRVVRAHVWLSSALFLRQDGFLSLTRVGGTEHVAHATLRSVEGKHIDQCSPSEAAQQQTCFRSVLVAWEEQSAIPGRNCPRFSLPEMHLAPAEGDSHERTKRQSNQQAALPRLDFQLFLLRPRSRGETSARSRPQTVYIGTSGWQLSVNDVEALVSSREVVFLTTMQDDLGTLEVKLRRVSPSDASRTEAVGRLAAEDDAVESPTGFSINWSSSEALQKDLAEKARLKSEADKKLIAQLKQAADKATKLIESRDYLIVHLHRSRSASKIQRQFRELQRKKQETIAKLRQEEEAHIAAKKVIVREKVIARNRQRAVAMRARLLEHLDNNKCSFSSRNIEPEDRMPVHGIAEHMETERAKLKERLAVLEMQRRHLTANQRTNAARSNQQSPQQRGDKLFDDELIRAVQELHFARSNQM